MIEAALRSADGLSHPPPLKLRILTSPHRRSINMPLTNVSLVYPRIEDEYMCFILTAYPVHAITPDELLEDNNLQIIAETDPAQRSDTKKLKNTIPIRVLTDFTVYEMDTLRLVPIGELFSLQHGSPMVYGASGNVKAFSDDGDEDEDDELDVFDEDDDFSELDVNQRVKLSRIMELDIHDFNRQKLDRFIPLSSVPIIVSYQDYTQ